MTHAWRIACRTWRQLGGRGSFMHLVNRYIRQGAYVIAHPDLFILAAPVRWEDGRMVHDDAEPDTWFIHMAALGPDRSVRFGEAIARFMQVAPFMLPSVAWERRKRSIRRYSWDSLLRKALPPN